MSSFGTLLPIQGVRSSGFSGECQLGLSGPNRGATMKKALPILLLLLLASPANAEGKMSGVTRNLFIGNMASQCTTLLQTMHQHDSDVVDSAMCGCIAE